jgi:tetratricopeptide (TPR) repeat protein
MAGVSLDPEDRLMKPDETTVGDAEFDEIDEQVDRLVREHQREQARRLLREGVDRAAAESPFWAGHFADRLGSLLLADSRDREALEAYLEAARLDPAEPTRALSVVNCLLEFLNRPGEALERVDAALASLDEGGWVYCDARGLRGVALVRLGRMREARELFERIALAANRLPATSCDLRLVEELVARGECLAECRLYLDIVEAKARTERNEDVAARSMRILARLDGS